MEQWATAVLQGKVPPALPAENATDAVRVFLDCLHAQAPLREEQVASGVATLPATALSMPGLRPARVVPKHVRCTTVPPDVKNSREFPTLSATPANSGPKDRALVRDMKKSCPSWTSVPPNLPSSSLVAHRKRVTAPSAPAPQAPNVSLTLVTVPSILGSLARFYADILRVGQAPRVLTELHFVMQLLTVTVATWDETRGGVLAASMSNAIFFAVYTLLHCGSILLPVLGPNVLRLLLDCDRIDLPGPDLRAALLTQIADGQASGAGGEMDATVSSSPALQDFESQLNAVLSVQVGQTVEQQRRVHDRVALLQDNIHTIRSSWELWSPIQLQEEQLKGPVANQYAILRKDCLERPQMFAKALVMELLATSSDPELKQLRKSNPSKTLALDTMDSRMKKPNKIMADQFFLLFLKKLDSYVLTTNVMDRLSYEILQLQQQAVRGDACRHILSLRQCARLLGRLMAEPYTSTEEADNGMWHVRAAVHGGLGTLDLRSHMQQACDRGHITVTLPWVCELMARLAPQATTLRLLPSFREVFELLARLLSHAQALPSSRVHVLWTELIGELFKMWNCPLDYAVKGPTTAVLHPTPEVSVVVIDTDLFEVLCPQLSAVRRQLQVFLQTRANDTRRANAKRMHPLSVFSTPQFAGILPVVREIGRGPSRWDGIKDGLNIGHLHHMVCTHVAFNTLHHIISVVIPAEANNLVRHFAGFRRAQKAAGSCVESPTLEQKRQSTIRYADDEKVDAVNTRTANKQGGEKESAVWQGGHTGYAVA